MSELSDLLTALPVPDHRPGFWEGLEARLAAVDAERPATSGNGQAATIDTDASVGPQIEGNAVLDLGLEDDSSPTSRHRWGVAVLAAAAAVLALVIGISMLTDDPEPSPVITDTPSTTSSPPRTTAPTDESEEDQDASVVEEETQPVPIQDLEPTEVTDVSTLVETLDPGALITSSPGSLWAATGPSDDSSTDSVIRIDPTSGEVTARIELPEAVEVRNLVAGPASIWAAGSDGQLHRIDPATNEIVAVVPVFDGDPILVHAEADADAIWLRRGALGDGVHELARIETGSTRVEKIDVPLESFHPVAAGPDSVWIGMPDGVRRFDPTTRQIVDELAIEGGSGLDLVVDDEAIWTIGSNRLVVRIDAATGEAVAQFAPPQASDTPSSAVVIGDHLFVATSLDGSVRLVRINTQTNTVERVFELGPDSGGSPLAGGSRLTVAGNHLWFDSTGVWPGGVPDDSRIRRIPLDAISQGAG